MKLFFKKTIPILFFIIIFIIGFITFKMKEKSQYNEIIEIKKGDSIIKIIAKIKPSKVFYFKIYLKFSNYGKDVKAGYYNIKGSYSIKEVVDILEKGKDKIFKITIPEGLTTKELIEKLENEKRINQSKFVEELSKIKFPYLTPNGNFEGYFYPDTYYFPEHFKEKDIIKSILNEFLEKYPPEKYPDKEEFYKKLIMASIIEREAKIKEDKSLISSVFYNRMEKGMKLSSDATVNYIFKYKKRRILYKDLKVESPYNTYINKGLPPTPIGNPDRDSIDAAYNPAETKYLFFVAKQDGSHYFSKTYKEHLKFQIENKNK